MKHAKPPLIEAVPLSGAASFTMRSFDLPAFTTPWHRHPEAELTWILEGSGLRHVGDSVEPFRAGDFCLLGPNLAHTWISTRAGDGCRQRARSFVVQFDPKRFGGAFWEMPECARILRLLKKSAAGVQFPSSCGQRLLVKLQSAGTAMARFTALLEVLDALARTSGARTLGLASAVSDPDPSSDPLLRRVLSHLGEQATGHVSQAELARRMGLRPSAFSRFFRRAMGRTFQAYLAEMRLALACRQLMETDRQVAEIAYASGFGNLSNFNRAFRLSRGLSPREFRRLSVL